MKTVATFNALHLGDNLVHLHFLRKMAAKYPDIQFTHGAPDEHLAQLYPLWQDVPNLTVKSIAEVGQGAINAWCGAGGFWYQQPDTSEWCTPMIRWFHQMAKLMELECPINEPADMLFDYPALEMPITIGSETCDFLIINSAPNSAQWHGYSADGFQNLAGWLHHQGKRVITTAPTGLREIPCTVDYCYDVTSIGKIAQAAKCIIGCVTGPMWPCLNIWSADTVKLRIHLQDREHVNMAPNTTHANSLSLVPEILRERGLL